MSNQILTPVPVGQDYSGPGSRINRDPETNIRYGIISCDAVDPDMLNEIHTCGIDLHYQETVTYFKQSLRRCFLDRPEARREAPAIVRKVMAEHFSDYKHSGDTKSKLDMIVAKIRDVSHDCIGDPVEEAVSHVFEELKDDFNETYQGDQSGCTRTDYEADNYKIHTDSYGDVWVVKSPYFTYAQFCSPCAPGAVSLSYPLVVESDGLTSEEKKVAQMKLFGANRGYCLGHEWFEGDTAPYPIFLVETGKEVVVTFG